MSRTKYLVVIALITITALLAIIYGTKNTASRETQLTVKNTIQDITLAEVYLENDTSNCLENLLEPGETVLLSVPRSNSAIRAIDTEGGVYNTAVTITDSTETLQTDISISDRTVFEETIESGGEYWSGSGSCTIRITNTLEEKDIYWLRVTGQGEDAENSPDKLGAFILFPGGTINIRVNYDCYILNAEDNFRNQYTCEIFPITPDIQNYSWQITRDDRLSPPAESGTGSSTLVLCNALDDWIITGIYHRRTDTTGWSENQLTATALAPKQHYSILLEPGTYDIRAVDEDNDTY
ncbi:MAG: hypothetical protein U9P42_06515, partial [Candidatus Fermentibacteria bacterium]|nr:hypothetical protein [Candidatus Fermentibacteria bacterium]